MASTDHALVIWDYPRNN